MRETWKPPEKKPKIDQEILRELRDLVARTARASLEIKTAADISEELARILNSGHIIQSYEDDPSTSSFTVWAKQRIAEGECITVDALERNSNIIVTAKARPLHNADSTFHHLRIYQFEVKS